MEAPEDDYDGIQDNKSFSDFSIPSTTSLLDNLNLNPNPNIHDNPSPSHSSVPSVLQDHRPEDDESNSSFSSYVVSPSPSLYDILQFSVPSLLHLSFNQDHGCFAAVIDHELLIHNSDPFREIFRRSFVGGIGFVEMFFRCSILALVGGGLDPVFPLNKVMIWDNNHNDCIGELSFRSGVRAVRLRCDRVIVVLEQTICVFNFGDFKLLHQIETMANPKGLCAISQNSGSIILVCPGLRKGQVRVEHYTTKRSKFIMAHDSIIACFDLTQDGKLLATASTKGTLVRIFNTLDGTLLQEVRRGTDRAEIYSLAFSSTARFLAVSSDKGTVHVFCLKVNSALPGNDESPSTSSSLSFFKGVLPKYFSSEWSVAQFRLREGSRYIVAFGRQTNTVVILGMDGSFYRCKFDPLTRGEMTQLESYNFLKKPEETH